MKRNPREMVLAEAALAFTKFFVELEQKHELTYAEMFSLLSECMQRLAQDQMKDDRGV
jgi:hypothetical protein